MSAARPRLGIVGGSFDPPHLGHLVIASEAQARCGLERVLFVPAAAPPHKGTEVRTPAPARLEMTALAVAPDERFAASGIETERELVYTVDTVHAVHDLYPEHELVFVMGSDSLLQLHTWRDPSGIFSLCTLAVAPRPGDDAAAIAAAVGRWGEGRVTLLDAPPVGISSSEVRSRVATGLPIRYLVPAAVEDYVRSHGLYRRA